MPVWAESPPPGDPTLLRLSRQLAEHWAGWVPAGIHVASRSARADVCKDKGHECPGDVARVLGVDRVVAFELNDDLSRMEVTLFERRGRLETVSSECTWNEGRVACDIAPMAAMARRWAVKKRNRAAVRAAFRAQIPRLVRCLDSARPASVRAEVSFVVQPDGRTTDVRIDPREHQARSDMACVARVVESLDFPLATGRGARFRFPIPRVGS